MRIGAAVDGPLGAAYGVWSGQLAELPVCSGFFGHLSIPWRLLLDLHSRMQPSAFIVIWNGGPRCEERQ